MKAPKLDKRSYGDIIESAKTLAAKYTPDWDSENTGDPGYRLMEVFGRLVELLGERLNKVPDKNFISFLDLVGVEQSPGRPAEVPITFLVSEKTPEGGLVPAGTQCATTQSANADAQVFETRTAFFATAAAIAKVVNLVPEIDRYSEVPLGELPPKAEELTSDTATLSLAPEPDALEQVEHIMYLANERLFGGKEPAHVKLRIHCENEASFFTDENVEWLRYDPGTKDWVRITEVNYSREDNHDEITFPNLSGVDKAEVDGVEDFWLACRFKGEAGLLKACPKVTSITGSISADGKPLSVPVIAAFYNTGLVDVTKPFAPFGPMPRYADAFYLCTDTPLIAEIVELKLTLEFEPYTAEYVGELFEDSSGTYNTAVKWEYLSIAGEWKPLATFTHTMGVENGVPQPIINKKGTADSQEYGALFAVEGVDGNAGGEIEFADDEMNSKGPFDEEAGLATLFQQEGYWIRALLTSKEPYGKDGRMEETDEPDNPFKYYKPTYVPPLVKTLEIAAKFKEDVDVSTVKTKNNFKFDSPPSNGNGSPFPLMPYQAVDSGELIYGSSPALYLGFNKKLENAFISLYILLAEIVSASESPLETGEPGIEWDYLADGGTWKRLAVTDETVDLTAGGTIGFAAPLDSAQKELFSSLVEANEDGNKSLFWYRALLVSGAYNYPPLIRGVFLNSVMADNQTTEQQDLIVGSSNGRPGQELKLVRKPVLAGELWVREPELPGEKEIEKLKKDYQDSLGDVTIEPDPSLDKVVLTSGAEQDQEPEVWVRWFKVPDFYASEARSRHYTIDSVRGVIRFGSGGEGNGKGGLIPPVGKDNIVMRALRTGGGETANSAATPLAVKELRTSLPFVDKVFNVRQAIGGSDPWSLEAVREFGPQSIKNRGRAVTIEDYEWMILEEFSQVKRVRCLAAQRPIGQDELKHAAGAVTVIVVPKSDEPAPQPSRSLAKQIRSYLKTKTLGNIAENLYVTGPKYVQISIDTVVNPVSSEQSSLVRRRVIERLEEFLHPLKGGNDGNGWAFGRDVYRSEVLAQLEKIEGVKYVRSVEFKDSAEHDFVKVGQNCLVTAEQIEVEVN